MNLKNITIISIFLYHNDITIGYETFSILQMPTFLPPVSLNMTSWTIPPMIFRKATGMCRICFIDMFDCPRV